MTPDPFSPRGVACFTSSGALFGGGLFCLVGALRENGPFCGQFVQPNMSAHTAAVAALTPWQYVG